MLNPIYNMVSNFANAGKFCADPAIRSRTNKVAETVQTVADNTPKKPDEPIIQPPNPAPVDPLPPQTTEPPKAEPLPLAQKVTKLEMKEEIKQYQKNVKDSIEKDELFFKEEKRRKATLLTSAIFNAFLLAAGFLTFVLLPTAMALIVPPVGIILATTFTCILVGSLCVGFGTYGLYGNFHDGLTKKEIEELAEHIEEMKSAAELFNANAGFDTFLSRFEGPYEIQDLKKYAKLFKTEQKHKENLEKLNSEKNQEVINSLINENQILKAEMETLEHQLHQEKTSGKDHKEEKIHPNLEEWIKKPIPKSSESHLVKFNDKKTIYTFGDEEELNAIDEATKKQLASLGYSPKYRFLSNNHIPSAGEIKINGVKYRTVEHYLQSQKAKAIKDDEGYHMILNAPSGRKAREIAYQRYGDYKLSAENKVMKQALFAKFVQADGESPTAEGIKLIKTGKKKLIAGHRRADLYNDHTWGATFTQDGGLALGENKLGTLLTELRAWLAEKNPDYVENSD